MATSLSSTGFSLGKTSHATALFVRALSFALGGTLIAAWLMVLTGCTTTAATTAEPAATQVAANTAEPQVLTLKEGDVLKVTFPSVPSMDTTQQVRQDGRITLPIIGEFIVNGKTTDAISTELLALYESQLVSKEVNVTLVSSSYTIYVTGAVLRPGKITTDRRLTAFDAIMEVGGFDKTKADLKAVTVVRQENGQTRSYSVNLQQVFDGGQSAPFFLKPFDTVYVPEKFVWF
jgi:polysaccharide export outer membrane protein